LLHNAAELKRIWLHELFHFMWWKLGNTTRRSWEQLLLSEKSKGELGWSAEWRKLKLTSPDRQSRSRKWREYCAESFCDTGAWAASLKHLPHPEITLCARARQARLKWWTEAIRYNLSGTNFQ
jgi:hypothetical protein